MDIFKALGINTKLLFNLISVFSFFASIFCLIKLSNLSYEYSMLKMSYDIPQVIAEQKDVKVITNNQNKFNDYDIYSNIRQDNLTNNLNSEEISAIHKINKNIDPNPDNINAITKYKTTVDQETLAVFLGKFDYRGEALAFSNKIRQKLLQIFVGKEVVIKKNDESGYDLFVINFNNNSEANDFCEVLIRYDIICSVNKLNAS